MYTYTTWLTEIANFLVVPVTDANFLTAVPAFIDDSEQRLYRELDLLNTITRDNSTTLTTGTRTFNLPSTNGTFVVLNDINVITPVGTSNPELGTRNPLVPASKEMLDYLYPSAIGSTVPAYFGMITQNQIVVGPWPDQAYQVEVVGTIRPTPLSSGNPTTFLTTALPDLWFAATMVAGASYLKAFGAAADDPKLAITWESHVATLLTSAKAEEARKKFTAEGWSSMSASPQATPPRT